MSLAMKRLAAEVASGSMSKRVAASPHEVSNADPAEAWRAADARCLGRMAKRHDDYGRLVPHLLRISKLGDKNPGRITARDIDGAGAYKTNYNADVALCQGGLV